MKFRHKLQEKFLEQQVKQWELKPNNNDEQWVQDLDSYQKGKPSDVKQTVKVMLNDLETTERLHQEKVKIHDLKDDLTNLEKGIKSRHDQFQFILDEEERQRKAASAVVDKKDKEQLVKQAQKHFNKVTEELYLL